MSATDNIAKLLQSGKQTYLNYDVKQPFAVEGRQINQNLTMMTSQPEYFKTGFNYTSLKMFDPQNQFDKASIYQQASQLLEFKLDIEQNCLVPQLFFFIQFRNNNTDVTKNIKHTSPMMNIESISLDIGSISRYTIKPEEIYVYNCSRISHGDKNFPNLIDNLGISSSYDIDPTTNNIAPGSLSRWYFFAIPLFANLNIPWNLLTNNTNQCLIKVNLKDNKFILPSSAGSYADLYLYDCKLVASQIFIPPTHYANIIKNGFIEYRINDTQPSMIQQLDTTSLINDNGQSVKITARQGGCCMFLIGLRERNNPLTFASFIPLNNVGIKRKDGSTVKNNVFNTDILKVFNTFENDTGEFFLQKELVAFSFDSMIDRIILMNYHGAVEVMEDEFYVNFQVLDKTNINAAKAYELVLIMYQPKLLRVNAATKDVELKF